MHKGKPAGADTRTEAALLSGHQIEQPEESSPAPIYQEEVPGGPKTCVVVSCKIKNSSYILPFNY